MKFMCADPKFRMSWFMPYIRDNAQIIFEIVFIFHISVKL